MWVMFSRFFAELKTTGVLCRLVSNASTLCCDTQGQGVLSDKLRSFSMQDLTLINTEDELDLHTSEVRARRDPSDEMSSGTSTLPRAKSVATRQSKTTYHFSVEFSSLTHQSLLVQSSSRCLAPLLNATFAKIV